MTKFDKDQLIADCLDAVRSEKRSATAVKEIVGKAISNPTAIESETRPWSDDPMITVWHNTDEMTALHIVWPPEVDLFPHDHNMWAVIGVYGGREDNQFYRRLEDGRIAPHAAKTMVRKDVEALGSEVVHSVRNPTREWTAAIHVYGGDFFTVKRTQWTMDTFEPTTLDPENLKRVLAEAAAKARMAATPGEQP
jgi:predicted metal-dependent enzyme (double-stranded beta helix superfamily)